MHGSLIDVGQFSFTYWFPFLHLSLPPLFPTHFSSFPLQPPRWLLLEVEVHFPILFRYSACGGGSGSGSGAFVFNIAFLETFITSWDSSLHNHS